MSTAPQLSVERLFLSYSVAKLRQYCSRIRECLEKLDEQQIWARGGDRQNAAGNLVLHLAGNVHQWISASIGGRPDTRTRDAEFAAKGGVARDALLRNLEEVVEEAAMVLEQLPPERLSQKVRIQEYDVSVLEAVYHVVEHFSQHTGQIIFLTKFLTGQDLGFYAHLTTSSQHGESIP